MLFDPRPTSRRWAFACLAATLASSTTLAQGAAVASQDAALQEAGAPAAPVRAPLAAPESPFGFSANLRGDVEFAVALRDLGPLLEGILDSNTVQRMAELWDPDGAAGLHEVRAGLAEVLAFAGSDVFFAMGHGSAKEVERLMKLQSAYDRVNARMMAAAMSGGRVEMPDIGEMILDELYARDGELLDDLHAMQLPRMILGTEVGPDLGRMVLDQARALEADLPPFVRVTDVEVPRAGTFRSWRLVARDAVEPGMLDGLAADLGPELAGDVRRILASKTVEVTLGLVDGVLVATVGPDRAHLDFAQFPDQALPSVPELTALAERYHTDRLVAFSYVARPLAQAFQVRGQMTVLAQVFSGVVRGMTGSGMADFGGAADRIDELGERLDRALAMEPETSAGVMWIEDGLRGASIGGVPMYGVDGERPLRFAPLAPPNAVMSVVSASTEEGVRDSVETMELLGELGVDLFWGFQSMEDGTDLEAAALADAMNALGPPLFEAWEILSTEMVESLGTEAAFFLDLEGDLPLLPDLPPVLQAQGRGPRIAMLEEVRDVDRLADAWNALVPTLHELTARIGELDPSVQLELPPVRSAGGEGLRTHFYELPFEHGDFLPAISLSSSALAMGSSRRWNEELLGRLMAPTSKADLPRGFHFELRLDAVHACAEGWLELVRSNMGPVFGEDMEAALEFREEYPEVRAFLDVTAGLGGLSYDRWKDGRWHGAWHLEVHDLD